MGVVKLAAVLLGFFASSVGAWVPTGAQDLTLRNECRPGSLARRIVDHFRGAEKLSFDPRVWRQFESIVQSHFNSCGDELQRSSLSNVLDYAEMAMVTYDVSQHPRMQEIRLEISGSDLKVRGFLALQNTVEARPLVIFQCGLTCDLNDPSMLFTLMVYHDMGPFHVLLLPSSSGYQFLKDNRVFAVGGLEEGRHIVDIASQIESGALSWSKYVSRIHLFGMSLGGHSSLYAALYADHLKLQSRLRGPLFSSVFVGCPVVDFKPSLEHITGESLIAKLLRRKIFHNVVEMLSFVPFFGQYFDAGDTSFKPSQAQLREMLVSGAWDYYKNRTVREEWGTPPFESLRFARESQLWETMKFSGQPLRHLQTPVYVWAPRNDEVVLFEQNSAQLFREDARLSERRIFRLDTPKGGHCAFPSLYGWAGASAMMNALFLARSPELLEQMRITHIKFPRRLGLSQRASPRRWRTDVTWIAVENKPHISLRMQFREVPCRTGAGGAQRCSGFEFMKFKYSELGLSEDLIPSSAVEAHGLTRWLNARLNLLDKKQSPLSKTDNPEFLQWRRFSSIGNSP
jgi:pimeloyl-ACP methyl ester carboxylesterase